MPARGGSATLDGGSFARLPLVRVGDREDASRVRLGGLLRGIAEGHGSVYLSWPASKTGGVGAQGSDLDSLDDADGGFGFVWPSHAIRAGCLTAALRSPRQR